MMDGWMVIIWHLQDTHPLVISYKCTYKADSFFLFYVPHISMPLNNFSITWSSAVFRFQCRLKHIFYWESKSIHIMYILSKNISCILDNLYLRNTLKHTKKIWGTQINKKIRSTMKQGASTLEFRLFADAGVSFHLQNLFSRNLP